METANYRKIKFICDYVLLVDLVCWGFQELCKRSLRIQSPSSMGVLPEGPGGRVSILGNPEDVKMGTLVTAICHLNGSQVEDHESWDLLPWNLRERCYIFKRRRCVLRNSRDMKKETLQKVIRIHERPSCRSWRGPLLSGNFGEREIVFIKRPFSLCKSKDS
jgi:hypothetical protein